MTYKEYLMSDEWKRKRDKRLLIDQKCSICGKPFDLQVHHMTYKTFPNEHTTDLITVCKNCHTRIESIKDQPWYDSFGIVNGLIINQFNIENENNDYSAGGHIDFCNLETVKRYLFPYMKEHGANLDYIGGTNKVIEYFRDKRYEVILNYIEHGYPKEIVKQRVRFSNSMIDKVYKNPEIAREAIKRRKRGI
jgi:hypothetical protein